MQEEYSGTWQRNESMSNTLVLFCTCDKGCSYSRDSGGDHETAVELPLSAHFFKEGGVFKLALDTRTIRTGPFFVYDQGPIWTPPLVFP